MSVVRAPRMRRSLREQLRTVADELREHPLLAARRRLAAVQRAQVGLPIGQRVHEQQSFAALALMAHADARENRLAAFVTAVQINEERDDTVPARTHFLGVARMRGIDEVVVVADRLAKIERGEGKFLTLDEVKQRFSNNS